MTAKFEEEFHGKASEDTQARARLFHLLRRFGRKTNVKFNGKTPVGPDSIEIDCMYQHEIWRICSPQAGNDTEYKLEVRDSRTADSRPQ